jgi:hypothetical protein
VRDPVHWIPIEAENSLRPKRSGTDHLRLQGESISVSAGNVDNGSDPLFPSERDGRQRRHPGLTGVIVGESDHVDCVGQDLDPLLYASGVRGAWQRNLSGGERPRGHRSTG